MSSNDAKRYRVFRFYILMICRFEISPFLAKVSFFVVCRLVICRLLQDFVEKRGTGVEVVYTLSGWFKTDPSVYHIRLVSKPKLTGSFTDES